jgi:hypothetical protein
VSVGARAGGNLPLSLIVLALSHVVLGGTATVTSDHLSSPFNKLVYIYPLFPLAGVDLLRHATSLKIDFSNISGCLRFPACRCSLTWPRLETGLS